MLAWSHEAERRALLIRKSRLALPRIESLKPKPMSILNSAISAGDHGRLGVRARPFGFSMIELMVVLAIILILSAIATPYLLNAIYLARTRSAADDLSGLVQLAKITAEKQNTTLPVYVGTVETGATGGFIGIGGSTWATGDPDVPFANGITAGAAASVPSALSPGFGPEATGTTLYFSPRGLPVKASGATYVASAGVIFYLTDPHSNWSAVSVSGSGRSKAWVWDGNSWH